ncbi:MAG: hypothetical protein PWQ18_945 [Clostridia bacterium]|nr:hypothetical protein [Clostridia bacterium]
MNKYLVDTSTWIEALHRRGNQVAREWLKASLLQEEVAIVPPVKAEILSGAINEKQFNRLQRELDAVAMLDRQDEVWEKAARLNFALRRQGLNLPLIDVLIASSALLHGYILVHHDRHYEMIKRAEPALITLVVPPLDEP